MVSGSRDGTVRLWDAISGCCVQVFTSHLGELTSVAISDSGTYVLSASKDNSNRLWDIRMRRTVQRYTSHQNTWKSFVRAGFFGPHDEMVASGSEDGSIYMWDRQTGNLIQKTEAQEGAVYATAWNASTSLLASCSDDGTVSTWHYTKHQNKEQNTEQKEEDTATTSRNNGSGCGQWAGGSGLL